MKPPQIRNEDTPGSPTVNHRLGHEGMIMKSTRKHKGGFMSLKLRAWTLVACTMFATANATTWEKSSVIGDRTFEYRWSAGTGYTNVSIYAIAPTEGDIVIPETLEGGPVVGFSKSSTGLLSVSGPDTTSVRLPKTVTYIGNSAFKNCGNWVAD